MESPATTNPGWYPDPNSGGTIYWDGSKWTGDRRPPRRPFAAASSHGPMGGLIIALGVLFAVIWAGAAIEEAEPGYFLLGIGMLIPALIGGVYLLRGQGPSTQDVVNRIEQERKEAQRRRRWANVASVVSSFTHRRPTEDSHVLGVLEKNDDERVWAMADPRTAQALQDLQNLQYTRVLTNEEFHAAKNILLGDQPWAPMNQLEQLTELHRTGVLGDIEFSAAKARLLGL